MPLLSSFSDIFGGPEDLVVEVNESLARVMICPGLVGISLI